MKTTNLARLHSITIEEESPQLFIGTRRFTRRDPAQATNKKNQKTHSQGRPCAYLTKVPQPSEQSGKQIIIEKATIPVKVALPNKGRSAIPMEERFWWPFPKAESYESHLKPRSKHAQNIRRGTSISKTIGTGEVSPLYHKVRDHLKSAKEKRQTNIFLMDIWKTNDVETIFSRKVSPKKRKNNGTVLRADQKENTSPSKPNVNIEITWTTGSTQQQVEQAPWPPPSIPNCRKQKNGIENIFVDKEAILPHNHRLPAASGKIGVVGNNGLIQARHRKRW